MEIVIMSILGVIFCIIIAYALAFFFFNFTQGVKKSRLGYELQRFAYIVKRILGIE